MAEKFSRQRRRRFQIENLGQFDQARGVILTVR
jgi:hypothetical protein